MKELLIFRHAKAVDSAEAPSDHERELKPRGEKTAQAVGALLSERKLTPDLILSSDAIRAMRTAELCEKELSSRVDVLAIGALYDCGPSDYIDLLSRQPDVVSRIMVVGHNPTLEELVEVLCGTRARLKPGSIARVSLSASFWRDMPDSPKASLEEIIEA